MGFLGSAARGGNITDSSDPVNRRWNISTPNWGQEDDPMAFASSQTSAAHVAQMFQRARTPHQEGKRAVKKDWRQSKFEMTQAREALAEYELNRFKNAYADLSVSNPYRDMENAFEDLTINQPRRNFERATFQQSQSNILNTIRRSSGAAAIANIAQSLVQQGQIAKQGQVADISQEVAMNKLTSAKQEGELEKLEASGVNIEAMFKKDQLSHLMSMSQQEMFMRMNEQLAIDSEASKAHHAMMKGAFGFAGGMMGASV